jgi:hypothetical protein
MRWDSDKSKPECNSDFTDHGWNYDDIRNGIAWEKYFCTKQDKVAKAAQHQKETQHLGEKPRLPDQISKG